MTVDRLTHEFVKSFPAPLEPDVLYISLDYDTTAHLCACGCGHRVILPLHPTAWKLTYDGAAVSMSPSVGNWSFPCQSHYWIERGRICWSTSLTRAQIQAGRDRTLRARTGTPLTKDSSVPSSPALSRWTRAWRWLRNSISR